VAAIVEPHGVKIRFFWGIGFHNPVIYELRSGKNWAAKETNYDRGAYSDALHHGPPSEINDCAMFPTDSFTCFGGKPTSMSYCRQ
jgi:hypothetical protein